MFLTQSSYEICETNLIETNYWDFLTEYTLLLLYGWKCHAKLGSRNPLRSVQNMSNITMRINA
ncbi:hypothetical protein WN48_00840 [Eufriesea mexicana]|nr:hypothetical protein WN48_00840 [Eufriesea mexicana]